MAGEKLRLAGVRGTALDSRTLFFVVEDGRLGERKWDGDRWVWHVHDVPEGGKAPYCSGDRTAPDSCMPLLDASPELTGSEAA